MTPSGRPAFAASLPLRSSALVRARATTVTPLHPVTRPSRVRVAPRAIAGDAQVSVTGIGNDEEPEPVEPVEPVGESSIGSLRDVQNMVELAKEFEIADLRLEDKGVVVEISMPGGRGFKDGKLRELSAPPQPAAQPMFPPGYAPVYGGGEEEEEEFEYEDEEDEDEDDEGEIFSTSSDVEPDDDGVFPTDFVVTSNRVGFFFSGAKGKPPLANVDDHVKFNQPVCIIEQLGQQYVYLSEVSGTVVKIFVEDGDAIMFGSKLMVIRPD